MKVSSLLLRVIREEIESIEYGKVTISVNESGPYVEVTTEKRKRVVKSEDTDTGGFHKG